MTRGWRFVGYDSQTVLSCADPGEGRVRSDSGFGEGMEFERWLMDHDRAIITASSWSNLKIKMTGGATDERVS